MSKPNEPSDAEKALAEVSALIEAEFAKIQLEQNIEKTNDDRAEEIEKQISMLRAQISDLQIMKRQYVDANYEVRKRVHKSKLEIQQFEDRKLIIEETAAREASLKDKLAELEEAASKFPWAGRILRHQREAAFMLADAKRGILADEPGLGKTLSSLAWADLCGAKKILVLVPGEVARNFVNEAGNWAPHREPYKLINMKRTQRMMVLDAMKHFDNCYVILNYEFLTNGRKSDLLKARRAIKAAKFDAIICDEAHRMKEVTRDLFQAVKDIILSENQNNPETGRPESSIKFSLMMTGTPILNRPTELYPLLYMTAPTVFYSEVAFKTEFCNYVPIPGNQDGRKHWVLKPGGSAGLQRKLAGFYLRRTYDTAGIELPEQGEILHEIVLDPTEYPKQYSIIKMLRDQCAMEIEEGRVDPVKNMLALLTRERQAAAWPGGIRIKEQVFDENGLPVFEFNDQLEFVEVYREVNVGLLYQESVKIDKAVEIAMESLDNRKRVVVFTKFKEAAHQVVKQMRDLGINAVEYSGDTPTKVKDELKEDFDIETAPQFGEHKYDVVVCQYNAAGIGLNLNAATVAIILDYEFNSGMRDQAYRRISRMGQTKETMIHILEIKGSADVYMRKLIERKEMLVDGFNVTMDAQADKNEFLAFLRSDLADAEDTDEDDE